MSDLEHVTILLVEDDPGHARLIEKNLRRAQISNDIHIVRDGKSAMNFLFRENEYSDSEWKKPLLVLLDLNLPVLNGYQILERLKADENTASIPVVILTTTNDSREVARCYDLGCNVYITKPVEYEQFCHAIRQLGLFLSVVTIPSGESK